MEPYRIFFPLSLFGAVAGVFLWVLAWILHKNWVDLPVNPYPVIHHINIMTALFLIPVVKGFVYTAIPRFTGTGFLRKIEITSLVLLQMFILTFTLFFKDSLFFYSLQTIDLGILFLFLSYRFKISKVNLSSYLYFILGGIFLGLMGSIFQLSSLFYDKTFLFQSGKDFIFYGMIPAIIFGTGTRMIPMIVNTENPTKKMEWMKKAETSTKVIQFLFVFSFLLEVMTSKLLPESSNFIFRGIRFMICAYWIIQYFHIFELDSFKTKLPRTLLFSCYMFLFGLAGYSFGLNYSVHLAHIYLIGGISLLITSIMTRVTLSHSGGDMTLEKESNIFYWIAGLLFISAITRGFVFLFPDLTTSHLAYAAILYILALLLWAVKIGRVIFMKQ